MLGSASRPVVGHRTTAGTAVETEAEEHSASARTSCFVVIDHTDFFFDHTLASSSIARSRVTPVAGFNLPLRSVYGIDAVPASPPPAPSVRSGGVKSGVSVLPWEEAPSIRLDRVKFLECLPLSFTSFTKGPFVKPSFRSRAFVKPSFRSRAFVKLSFTIEEANAEPKPRWEK